MRTLMAGMLLLLASAASLAAGPGTLRVFSAVEVMEIDNKRNPQGKKLPDEWMPRLREQLRYAVGSLHLFHRVEDQTDPASTGADTGRVVRMHVRIIDYSGAQARPKVSAQVVLVDKETGDKVLDQRVDAQLHFDQGATTGALVKLCNKVGELVKDNW